VGDYRHVREHALLEFRARQAKVHAHLSGATHRFDSTHEKRQKEHGNDSTGFPGCHRSGGEQMAVPQFDAKRDA
jgi:hypothetical protein